MIKMFLLTLGLCLFAGCYTQLLTRSDLSGGYVAPPSSAADSSVQTGGSVPAASAQGSVSPVPQQGLNDCNCTPFAINNGLCWCLCDRCGTYHRLGYEYCPRGIYNSYWGWDYYQEYPWWYSTYNRHHRPGDNGYGGGYYGNSSGAGTSYDNSGKTIYLKQSRKKNRGEFEGGGALVPVRKETQSSDTLRKPATPEAAATPAAVPVYQGSGSSSSTTVNPAPSGSGEEDKPATVVPTGKERKKNRGEF